MLFDLVEKIVICVEAQFEYPQFFRLSECPQVRDCRPSWVNVRAIVPLLRTCLRRLEVSSVSVRFSVVVPPASADDAPGRGGRRTFRAETSMVNNPENELLGI